MIRLTKDDKRLVVLTVFGAGEVGNAHDCAVLAIEPEVIALCLRRCELFRLHSAQSDQGALYSHEYWDCSVDYYAADVEAGPDERDDPNDDTPTPSWSDECGRTESEMMVVTSDAVQWSAYVKHTDTRIETITIPLATLKEWQVEITGDGDGIPRCADCLEALPCPNSCAAVRGNETYQDLNAPDNEERAEQQAKIQRELKR